MRHQYQALVGMVAVTLAGVMSAAVPVKGQAAAEKASGRKAGSVPRAAWGDPDLQGTWNTDSSVPFERPDRFAGRALMTDEELAKAQEQFLKDSRDRPPRAGDPGTYNAFWSDRGTPARQTSLVVDPPDGKLPPLTPAGQEAGAKRRLGAGSWEDRHIWERCVTRGGMPNAMVPRFYNNNMQILQTPGYVVILLEQIHEARIIPTDGRPHLPQGVRQWLGDSRGRWEGDSLVVETTQLAEKASSLQPWASFSSISGSGVGMQITERFTRVDAHEIAYRMTIDDPQMYTKPWTVAFPMRKTEELIYEYACHEGNYGLEGILKGGRAGDGKAGGDRE